MLKSYKQRHVQIRKGGLYFKINLEEMKVIKSRRSKFRSIRIETDLPEIEGII